jgi:uncharacterized membrane protein YeaQ/YmgE (transglycosylase-associated protein family)
MGGLLTAILIGLIIGLLAKALIAGNAVGDFLATILVGLIGAIFGDWLGGLIEGRGAAGFRGFGAVRFVLAILFAVLLEWLYRRAIRGRMARG